MGYPLGFIQSVLEQLPKWFEDYNNHDPHKGLKMMVTILNHHFFVSGLTGATPILSGPGFGLTLL